MTTENNSPETENDDIPPVQRMFGLAVSEWVTYSFIVVSVVAAVFGYIVGGERDAQAERAMTTLSTLTENAEKRYASSGPLACDNSLLNPEQLANDYLTLSVSKAPFDEDDTSLGYGPALYVSVEEKEVSGDTWDTAKRLMDLVKEAGKEKAEAEQAEVRREIADNIALEKEEGEADEKPKNALREVKKKSFGDEEDYLRYYILASEVAVCSPGA